jgi:hypothetical protein
MSKRFIDTNLDQEDWYMAMPLSYQHFWVHLFSKCDHAGLFRVNTKDFNFKHHARVLADKALAFFNAGKERIKVIKDGLWYIVDFCSFQYGSIKNLNNHVNASINNIHKKYGITEGLDNKKMDTVDELKMPENVSECFKSFQTVLGEAQNVDNQQTSKVGSKWGVNTLYLNNTLNKKELNTNTEIQNTENSVEDLRAKETEQLKKENEELKKKLKKLEEKSLELLKQNFKNSKNEKTELFQKPEPILEIPAEPEKPTEKEQTQQQPEKPKEPIKPSKPANNFPVSEGNKCTLTPAMIDKAREIYKRARMVLLTPEEVLNYYELFKLEKFNGCNFYQSLNDVLNHFHNWLKQQKHVPLKKPEQARPETVFVGNVDIATAAYFERMRMVERELAAAAAEKMKIA